jgi:nitroimidazol reductase NimA-like FMN-containing flavoprotein (pyridoxamine 5'-phosphate oxidase superfamily)
MTDATPLTDAERDDFLGTGGTGVLSFASDADTPPHAIPVSYGYDASAAAFYLRLAVGGDSAKADLVDRPVTLVVYEEVAGAWHSVVASGRLESTDDEAVANEALAGLDRVDIRLHDVFGRPIREVSFGFYRLIPDDLTTLRETPTAV